MLKSKKRIAVHDREEKPDHFGLVHDSSQDTVGMHPAVPEPMSSAGSIRTHNVDLDCDRGGPDLSGSSIGERVFSGIDPWPWFEASGSLHRLGTLKALVRRVGFVLCPGVECRRTVKKKGSWLFDLGNRFSLFLMFCAKAIVPLFVDNHACL